MEELQKKIRTVLDEIEQKLKSQEDVEFAKTKVLELYEMFADELEKIQENCSNKIDIIAAKYSLLETKMEEVENAIDRIKEDIYIEDKENYDLDIVCPYCDAEFSVEISDELKDEVQCPECKNVIELDWDEECEHDCSGCHHECDHSEHEEDEDM